MDKMKREIADMHDPHKKLKELILYISARNATNPKFGKIKLNKILFYSDIQAYFELGKSITGEEYFKLPLGPAPKRMKPVLTEMEKDEDITTIYVDWGINRQQHRIAPQKKYDLSVITAEELAILEKVIQWLWDENANEVSNNSHKFVAWKKVKDTETIPFETAAFVCHPDDVVVTKEALDRAKKFAEKR